MSQRQDIREALERGESLTRLDYLNRFGCIEGGARITELRQEGMDIQTQMIQHENALGEKKRYARWYLSDEQASVKLAYRKSSTGFGWGV